MPYAIRYRCDVVFVAAGRGLGMSAAEQMGPGMTGGNEQVLTFFDAVQPNSATFLAADVTALLLAMSNDLSAQMSTAANLGRIQAFASGGG
jgi:hypothetical protein